MGAARTEGRRQMDKRRDYEITVNHWLQHCAAQFPRLIAREAATGERVYGDLLREQAP